MALQFPSTSQPSPSASASAISNLTSPSLPSTVQEASPQASSFATRHHQEAEPTGYEQDPRLPQEAFPGLLDASKGSGPIPPIMGHAISPEAANVNVAALAAPGLSANISPTSFHTQKRAYRQRRKDPSCDACRERKVKLLRVYEQGRQMPIYEGDEQAHVDHKVQDLERQLSHTRQQLNYLRSATKDVAQPASNASFSKGVTIRRAEREHKVERRSSARLSQDLPRIRSNLRRHGRGIVKPPPLQRPADEPSSPNRVFADLPSRAVADRCLSYYHSSTNAHFPILDWSTFTQEYETAYSHGDFERLPRAWRSVFFAVLACGMLRSSSPLMERLHIARTFMERSVDILGRWTDNYTLDHARQALLSSIFLFEVNMRSASWIRHGKSVMIAQDIGLHQESHGTSTVDVDVRRRVWWSIYIWDRLLALELGRPIHISDEDCDVSLPQDLDEAGRSRGTSGLSATDAALFGDIFRFGQLYGQVAASYKARLIQRSILVETEGRLQTLGASLSGHVQSPLGSEAVPLLQPIIYVQNARLVLQRHGLSPLYPPDHRSRAVDQCVSVAVDTSRLLARWLREQTVGPVPSTAEYHSVMSLGGSISSMLCTHIWRCLLFLCFAAHYADALVCVQAYEAINDACPVNLACGRYLGFFLDALTDKIQRGEGHLLRGDEEMLAYVSGDVQGDAAHSWVWQSGATQASSDLFRADAVDSPLLDPFQTVLTEEEAIVWGGWDRVKRRVENLMGIDPEAHRGLTDLATPTAPPTPTRPASSETSGRISIASII